MRKNTRYRSITKPLIVAVSALLTSISATADDLDVFSAVLNTQNKPNILFILDYSGSMKREVTITDDDGVETFDSRINVLRTAVDSMLVANTGKINVGIGSIYASTASGVRWPISDLADDASIYDPDIAVGTKTVADVVSSQLYRAEARGDTSTVNALAEAAAYYRGDEVLHSDKPTIEPLWHEPDQWNGTEYADGNISAAMPSTYTSSTSSPAYERDVATWTGSHGWCTDSDTDSGCEGESTFECVFTPAETIESDPSDPDAEDVSIPARTICKTVQFDNFTTPTYNAPTVNACQANYILLISDGEPTVVTDSTTIQTSLLAAGVPGGSMDNCEDLSNSIFGKDAGEKVVGNCGPEILRYLATTPMDPDIEDSVVKTFTIGFGIGSNGTSYLQRLADEGDGAFFMATDPESLTNALNEVINNIIGESQNFAELSIDVDPSSFSHSDSTYVSLFTPSGQSSWEGNLKGYFIGEDKLVDVTGQDATISDESGIQFLPTAQSFWSSVQDGNTVEMGGASENIIEFGAAPNLRNIFTNIGGFNTSLNTANTAIDDDLLGNPGDALRTESLNWLANAPMGDPLHTKPIAVNYAGDQKVVYIMTNQGLLHGIDASTPIVANATTPDLTGGDELFAFMPEELLSNIPKLYQPSIGEAHIYGLDGTITRWHEDANEDGIVNGTDTIMLVIGMRRGGSSYYAIDVTNPSSPELKWQISSDDIGFENMAQSWSRASLVSVNNGGNSERKLMFGGGYDAAVVDGTTAPTEANGNAIFMVDFDGTLVWSIDDTDHSDMNYSIPADLTIIDSDQNGMADRAYFGDLGGQVWRVDFDDITQSGETTITKLADISNRDHQPFFYSPSISLNTDNGIRFIAVSIGSGDRTQPLLEDSDNALYMFRDTDYEVGAPDASFTTITASNIYDATDNDIGSDNEAIANAANSALETARGWVVYLNSSEKSLSQVVVFEGKYLATTFEPATAPTASGNPDACGVSTTGRLYIMNILDAQPIEINSDGSDSIASPDAAKRTTNLQARMGIPTKPLIYFPSEDGDGNKSGPQIIVGKEIAADLNTQIHTVFWHAK